MLKEIISERCLEKAYSILCKQHKNYNAYADIMLYEQLLINRNHIYKNKFTNTVSIKSIEQYFLFLLVSHRTSIIARTLPILSHIIIPIIIPTF